MVRSYLNLIFSNVYYALCSQLSLISGSSDEKDLTA
jgi:hypothetical protein